MGLFKTVGKAAKQPIVRFPKWLGFSHLWGSAKTISHMGKGLAVSEKTVRVETFEEAVARLNLTEADLKRRMRQLLITTYLYLAIALALFIFTIYLFMHVGTGAGLTGIAVTFLDLVFAFREHFHYVQMRQRRLGGNFKTWLSYFFKRDTLHA